jgi:hypothetical protein
MVPVFSGGVQVTGTNDSARLFSYATTSDTNDPVFVMRQKEFCVTNKPSRYYRVQVFVP